jgi:choline-glycine betaine transporter
MRYLLLGLPCALALAAPLYNAIEPKLFGFPLFFWAQLALIPVSALCILAVYLGERR